MEENRYMHTPSVDAGGSGIKVIVLTQLAILKLNGRVETPQPATPEAVIRIAQLAARQGEFDRVSVGFPVVRRGVTETAVNLDSVEV